MMIGSSKGRTMAASPPCDGEASSPAQHNAVLFEIYDLNGSWPCLDVTAAQHPEHDEEDCCSISQRSQSCASRILDGSVTTDAEFVARGGTAAVHRVRRSNSSDLADKRILVCREYHDAIEAELAFFAACDAHGDAPLPGVVRTVGVVDADDTCHVLMEYMGGGTLASLPPAQLDAAMLRSIAAQLTQGLATLHDKLRIVHKDLTPSNVLLSADGTTVKIADFGMSETLEAAAAAGTPAIAACCTFTGSVSHMSPERLRGEPFGAASDVWALGVTLLQLHLGHNPFVPRAHAMTHQEKFWAFATGTGAMLSDDADQQRVIDAVLEPVAATALGRFVSACLRAKPQDRPTASDLLRHAYLSP